MIDVRERLQFPSGVSGIAAAYFSGGGILPYMLEHLLAQDARKRILPRMDGPSKTQNA